MMSGQPILPYWGFVAFLGAVLPPDATRIASSTQVDMLALWKSKRVRARAMHVRRSPQPSLSSHLSWFQFLLSFLWYIPDPQRSALHMHSAYARGVFSFA